MSGRRGRSRRRRQRAAVWVNRAHPPRRLPLLASMGTLASAGTLTAETITFGQGGVEVLVGTGTLTATATAAPITVFDLIDDELDDLDDDDDADYPYIPAPPPWVVVVWTESVALRDGSRTNSLRASWSYYPDKDQAEQAAARVDWQLNPTVVNIAKKPWARPFSMTDCLVNRERRQWNSTAAGLLAVWNGDSEDTPQVRRVPVARPPQVAPTMFGGSVLNAAATPITPIMLFGGGVLSATALAAAPRFALVQHPAAPDRYGGFAPTFSYFATRQAAVHAARPLREHGLSVTIVDITVTPKRPSDAYSTILAALTREAKEGENRRARRGTTAKNPTRPRNPRAARAGAAHRLRRRSRQVAHAAGRHVST